MATKLGSDISLIQHEDVLLEMLRQTEDFGKKKEIRVRIHELRKQRLNEFYTREMIQIETTSKRSSTESITDQKFMTMKTKVIGDSESPTEVYQKKSNANTNFPVKEVKSKKKFNIVKQSTIINRTSTIIPQDKSPVPDVKPKEKSPVKLRENFSVKEIKPSSKDGIKKIDIEVHDTSTNANTQTPTLIWKISEAPDFKSRKEFFENRKLNDNSEKETLKKIIKLSSIKNHRASFEESIDKKTLLQDKTNVSKQTTLDTKIRSPDRITESLKKIMNTELFDVKVEKINKSRKLLGSKTVKDRKATFENNDVVEKLARATETLERSTTKSPERKLLIDFKVDTSRNYHEQYTATTTKQRTTTTAETEFGVTTKPALVPKDTPTIIQSTKIHTTDDEMQIEKIFDLQILEIMLEKIAGYDRKRRIIAQIRIVKRQLEPSKIGKDTTNTISRVSKTVRDGLPAKLQKLNNSKTVHEVDFVNSNQIDNKSVGGKNTKDKFESILKRFRQESFDQNSRRSSKESNGYEKIEGSPQSTPRSNLVRGDSIKALQHKFQQATVSSSFKQNNSAKSKSPNTVRQTKVQTVINKLNLSKTDDSIFLHNNSKATGIQDVLTKMRNADLVVETGDTSEDIEARALSNKILGASVIPHGMEQGEMSPISNQTATKSSASLINQVEKQRAQKSPVTRNNLNKTELDNIWIEKQLHILLESCPDYDQRRQIRARLRQIKAEHKEQSNWSNQFGCIKATFERGTPQTTEVCPNKNNVAKQYLNNICKCPSENSIPYRSKKITSFKPVGSDENGFSHVVKSVFKVAEAAQNPIVPGPLPLQSGILDFWHQTTMGQRKAASRSTAAGASTAVGKMQRPLVSSVTPYEGYLAEEEITHEQDIVRKHLRTIESPVKQQRALPKLVKLNDDINKVDETFEILFKESSK